MKTIAVSPRLSEEQTRDLAGTLLDDASYDLLIREDARVEDESGRPLLVVRRNALSAESCAAAYKHLIRTDLYFPGSNNRGYATGAGETGEVRKFRQRQDGTLSQTNITPADRDVRSGIVGYFDRTPRAPFCRQTAFNSKFPERFAEIVPFVREVNAVFAVQLPDRYAAQKAVAESGSLDFIISGTVFSTITINRNWQTAVHQDAGDLREGFGVLSVLRAGEYTGGYFVLPRYRVAVDLRTRDVLLADVHEWHGNTAIRGEPGRHERISCVFYYRENMRYCGSAEQELELEFAKARPAGSPLLRAKPGES